MFVVAIPLSCTHNHSILLHDVITDVCNNYTCTHMHDVVTLLQLDVPIVELELSTGLSDSLISKIVNQFDVMRYLNSCNKVVFLSDI